MKFKLYPSNWDYQTWRKFFVIAGIWNFSFALPALLFPSFMVRLMYGFQTSDFYILYLNSSFFGTVLIFDETITGFRLPGDISASARYYETDIAGPGFALNHDSTINVPEQPGLGIEMDLEALERFSLRKTRLAF